MNMSEVKHTAFPWNVEDGVTTGKKIIAPNAAKSKRNVAHIGGPDREDNAAFLLRAAQSYEPDQAKIAALVEIAEELRSAIETRSIINNNQDTDDIGWFKEKIDAALKLAEGQS